MSLHVLYRRVHIKRVLTECDMHFKEHIVKSPFSLKEEHDDNTSSLLDALLRVSYFAPIVDIIQISYGMVYALCRSLTAQRLSMNNFDFNVLSVYTLREYTTQHTVSCLADDTIFF